MLKFKWTNLTITSPTDFQTLKNIVNDVKPTVGAMDTETDGLHIINNKPFNMLIINHIYIRISYIWRQIFNSQIF